MRLFSFPVYSNQVQKYIRFEARPQHVVTPDLDIFKVHIYRQIFWTRRAPEDILFNSAFARSDTFIKECFKISTSGHSEDGNDTVDSSICPRVFPSHCSGSSSPRQARNWSVRHEFLNIGQPLGDRDYEARHRKKPSRFPVPSIVSFLTGFGLTVFPYKKLCSRPGRRQPRRSHFPPHLTSLRSTCFGISFRSRWQHSRCNVSLLLPPVSLNRIADVPWPPPRHRRTTSM